MARLKALGVPFNSQSISWARIFPFGKGPINEQGIKHYDDVIAEHVRLGITPILTLFHWDTPLALMNEYGSWSSPEIVGDYVNYAKFVIQRYDEYVPVWYAFNEYVQCNQNPAANMRYSDHSTTIGPSIASFNTHRTRMQSFTLGTITFQGAYQRNILVAISLFSRAPRS